MTRAELEQDCDFLGLIIMQVKLMKGMMTTKTPNLSQNLLKKETFGAIAELHQVRSCGPCLFVGTKISKISQENQGI